MRATAKDLRFQSKKLLDAVARGDDVVITFRGKPCAKLVPFHDASSTEKLSGEDELFGIWRDRDEIVDVEGYIRSVRKGRSF